MPPFQKHNPFELEIGALLEKLLGSFVCGGRPDSTGAWERKAANTVGSLTRAAAEFLCCLVLGLSLNVYSLTCCEVYDTLVVVST